VHNARYLIVALCVAVGNIRARSAHPGQLFNKVGVYYSWVRGTQTKGENTSMARRLVIPLGANWRQKPAAMLLVFLVLVALLAVSVFLFVTDYITSVYGYFRLGTQRVSDAEAWFVGALPQLVQVAFGFMALERRNWLFAVLAGAAMIADIGTDVTFRVGDAQGFALYVTAILQSIVLFTLGSEFLLVASLENIIEYLPDVLEAMAISSGRLVDSFTRVADTLREDEDDVHPVAQRKSKSGGGRGP
jgi:hypothetical protein